MDGSNSVGTFEVSLASEQLWHSLSTPSLSGLRSTQIRTSPDLFGITVAKHLVSEHVVVASLDELVQYSDILFHSLSRLLVLTVESGPLEDHILPNFEETV